MNNNIWLKVFRSIGIVFFVIVSLLIVYFIKTQQYEAVVKLLVPLGVLISAFVASYSVMISIDNTNKIEKEKEVKKLYSRLDISFYILDKNKEYIKLLEEYTKTDNPLFHKNSIVDILNLSLKNLKKLEQQITVPPISIARTEIYILEMKFIVDKLPEQRGIKLTKEFKELLENLKGVTENFNKILTEEHCSSSK